MPKTLSEELILYDVQELAKTLDVQERTIRQLLRDGRIRGRKLARKWYVTEDALQEYFDQPEAKESEDQEDLQPTERP
jgi:excisionase family DNA binding protein